MLGFVGLGTMGGRIAARLLAAGHELVGWNRTRERAAALLDAGLGWRESPRAAAASADVVFSMLRDPAALAAVARGPDGILAGLREGSLWVDLGTVGPALVRELADEASARGAALVDAPVSGSPALVEQGQATFMASGDPAAVERASALLLDVGRAVTPVGVAGQASLLKLAVNLSVAVQVATLAEGVALAERGGIPRETAVGVLQESSVASPALRFRAPFLLELPEQAWFDVEMMQKDLLLGLAAGRELGVPLPTTAVANELLTATRAAGLQHEDFAALFRVLARASGLEA